MPSKRFDLMQAKEVPGRDKPVWIRHGVAFDKDGKVSIKLESIPLPNKDGEIWLKLFEPREGGQGSRNDDFSF